MRYQLYRKLTSELQRRLPGASQPQVRNQALLTQALVFSEDCHLPNLALQLPIAGQRESLIQWLRRFLDNVHLSQRVHYQPLIRQMFSRWPDREVNLIMDRTDLGQQLSLLVLGAAFKHRAIALNWRVLPFGGTGELIQLELLREIQPLLPPEKRIMFYGDSEFRAVKVQGYCRAQKWGWQVGVKSDTLFHQGDENWQPLHTIAVKPGQRCYLEGVSLTKSEAFGPVAVMADWTYQGDRPRYVACQQAATGRSWRQGRKRFWIEPAFRDWKSYGFDLECSQITNKQRLERLLLGFATATLWLLHLGHWLVVTNRAAWLTADHRQDYSLFRLGRDYARRCQLWAWSLPICFQR